MNSADPPRGTGPRLVALLIAGLAVAALSWVASTQGSAKPVATAAVVAAAVLGIRQALNHGRLSELRRVARAFAAGDLDSRASLHGSDSTARLGKELNTLGQNLAAARGELEAQRRLLDGALGSLAEGVACIDVMDRIVYANPAWRHLTASGNGSTGSAYYEHIPAAALAHAVGAARESGTATDGLEFEHRRHRLRASVSRSGDVVVAVLHDLTELKRLESARRDFVASVSHELKTPLTAIAGFAETLLDGTIEEDQAATRDMVGRIARHADRLTVLVRDVLTLSRLEQGSWEVHPAPCDLAEIARQLADEHQSAAMAKQVRIAIESPERLDLVSDRELLRQLLGNLMSNAVRYNRVGGSVTVRLEPSPADRVTMLVRDTGIGIPPEHRDRVFERFYRIDAHRSRQSGGTGLGLAIVKQLVDTLQGSIDLASGPDGTTFTVNLPQVDARADSRNR